MPFRECCINAFHGASVVNFSSGTFFLKSQVTIDTDASLADLASSLHVFSDVTMAPMGNDKCQQTFNLRHIFIINFHGPSGLYLIFH